MKRKRPLTWLEMAAAIVCLALPVWPLTRWCSGRPLGFDCEAWLILGVNVFLPFGLLALACSIWSMRSDSWAPHLVFAAGCLAVMGFFAFVAAQ
jgi:hypothetical protein